MGAYAELRRVDAFAAQMIVADVDCASLARGVNQRYGSPAFPQVVSRQFLSKLKNGKVRRCSPALAERICSVLGVATPALFDMRGAHNSDVRNAQGLAA